MGIPPDIVHEDNVYAVIADWVAEGWRIAPPAHPNEISTRPTCTWCGETGGRAALIFERDRERRWLAFCQLCWHAVWMEL